MITKAGEELIKRFEGLRLKAYLCAGKKWTIGWGSTYYPEGGDVRAGDEISEERAEEMFKFNLKRFEAGVDYLVKVPINMHQRSALVSLAYNIGLEELSRSTLLKVINNNPNDKVAITAQFLRWTKAKGKTLNGLIARRSAEVSLYFNVEK